MQYHNYMASVKSVSLHCISSGVSQSGIAAFFCKIDFGQRRFSTCCFGFTQPYLIDKRMTWSVRSSLNDSGFSSSTSNGTNGRTRIIRVIQEFQTKLGSKIQEVKKNLPLKLLSFLVGFYCATAFATVIGQTGDWDILSAGLAVIIVEGIGALMYRTSVPFFSKEVHIVAVVFEYLVFVLLMTFGSFTSLDIIWTVTSNVSMAESHHSNSEGLLIFKFWKVILTKWNKQTKLFIGLGVASTDDQPQILSQHVTYRSQGNSIQWQDATDI